MRSEQWILIDNLKRKLFIKYELKQFLLKSILKSNYTTNLQKYYITYRKTKLKRWAAISQQTNRCFRTGRPWYVNKLTRYSRFKFRTESYTGNLPGFSRASW
uniref:Ribosomal protein S14 n=1 Tax=Pseudourostyla cristata TaxID=293816 RepID=A0A4V1HFN3_9SPIT|nr:ribosomal protein S14 [Pseudourostyla cristata]